MTAAVVALCLLGLGNLAVMMIAIRRLNEHTETLDRLAGGPPSTIRPAGATVEDFTVAARGGMPVARDLLPAPTLVGFFSPGCDACHEQLPGFTARARRAPTGRTLAVVVGAEDAAADMVARLEDVAVVVVERPDGALARAFGVRGFPAFALVGEHGRIEASGAQPDALPLIVAA